MGAGAFVSVDHFNTDFGDQKLALMAKLAQRRLPVPTKWPLLEAISKPGDCR
jgi:hypothetical protein